MTGPPLHEKSRRSAKPQTALKFNDVDGKGSTADKETQDCALPREFAATASAVTAKVADWLAGQGVPHDILYGPHSSVVGVQRTVVERGYFLPDDNGCPTLIVRASQGYGPCGLDPYDFVSTPGCAIRLRGGNDRWRAATGSPKPKPGHMQRSLDCREIARAANTNGAKF